MLCLCAQHEVHVLGWLLNHEKWAHHGPTQKLRFPIQPDWSTLLPVTWLAHYIFGGTSIEPMGGAVAWAPSMSSLTQVVCLPYTGYHDLLLLTWLSALNSRHAPHTTATYQYR
jgi:hypothetical protein